VGAADLKQQAGEASVTTISASSRNRFSPRSPGAGHPARIRVAPRPAHRRLLEVGGYISHTVRSGDTLWEIAASYSPPGRDVRDLIVDIKAANELDSSAIVPGQVLVIPVAIPEA
jgi:nucleoid-associated protein YgaU